MREVDQVRTLIDELPSAGELPIEPPLLLIANTPAVAIDPAHVHQWSERPGIDDFTRLTHGGMEAVIVSDLGDADVAPSRRSNRGHFVEVAARRLLDKHVFAAIETRYRDRAETVMRRRHHNGVEGGMRSDGPPIGGRLRPDFGGQRTRSFRYDVHDRNYLVAERAHCGGSSASD